MSTNSEKPYAEIVTDVARAEVDPALAVRRLTATLQDFKMLKENPAWIDMAGFIKEKLSHCKRRLEIETEGSEVAALQRAIKELRKVLGLPDYIINAFNDLKQEELDDAKVVQADKEQQKNLLGGKTYESATK